MGGWLTSAQAGTGKYKFLEDALYVMSGRFIVDSKGTGVEYKISQVVV